MIQRSSLFRSICSILIVTLVLGGLFSIDLSAAVPAYMTISGTLSIGGKAVTGSQSVIFALYPSGNTTTPIWTETVANVTFSTGNFCVDIGRSTALSADILNASPSVRMAMTVNGTKTFKDFVSVPYSLLAEKTLSVDWSGVSSKPAIGALSGTLNISQIPNTIITNAHIATNAAIPFSKLLITKDNIVSLGIPSSNAASVNIVSLVQQNGFVTSAQVETQIAAKGYQTQSQVAAYVANLNIAPSSSPLLGTLSSLNVMGKVGIGTTTPTQLLDVSGNAQISQIKLSSGLLHVGYDPNNYNLGKIAFHHTHTTPGDQYYTGFVYNNSSGQFSLETGPASNTMIAMGSYPNYDVLNFSSVTWNAASSSKQFIPRMTVRGASGFVGIGTITPTEKLEVIGNIKATQFIGDGSRLTGIVTNVGNSFVVSASGNVGIGTNTPHSGYALTVGMPGLLINGQSGSNGLTVYRTLGTNQFNINVDSTTAQLSSGPSQPIVFLQGNSEKMRVDASGNVGIGTIPTKGLHLFGNTTDRSTLKVQGYSSTATATIELQSGGSIFKVASIYGGGLLFSQVDVADRMIISPYGAIGIGTTAPQAPFHLFPPSISGVQDGLILEDPGSGSSEGLRILFSSQSSPRMADIHSVSELAGTGGRLVFATNSSSAPGTLTDRMVITASGNVGIGTSTPTQKLQVTGTVIATSFIGDGSQLTGVATSLAPVLNVVSGKIGVGTLSPTSKLSIQPLSSESGLPIMNAKDSNGINRFFIGNTGKIGVGTVTPKYEFVVNGTMASTKLIVSVLSNLVADYVFEPTYSLRPLSEVESYIQKNKHLPNVPSRKDVEANQGIEVGEFQMKLLEKIEELTLYLIQQNKKLEQQAEEIEALKRSVLDSKGR